MPNDVVSLLCDLVSIPSVNPMGRDLSGPEFFEGRLSDWLAGWFQLLNVPFERIEVVPGRDNLIARLDGDGDSASRPTILLDAHQDTVPVDGMTIPPFTPEVRDGRVYGRGSCDVKGGMASMLWAFQRLVKDRPSGRANVILSCTCDEEATTLGITDLVRGWTESCGRSSLLAQAPDMAIIAEPTELDVVVAHRGATRFCLKTHGRACHSSDPTQGINAIYRMGRVLEVLAEYANVLPGQVSPHPRCGSATLSVGRIYGGASVNVVPDECTIEIDRRVVPGEDQSQVVTAIREFLLPRIDFDVEFVDPWLNSPTLNDTINGPLAEALLQHIAAVDGPHKTVGVPYGTHASRTHAGGVPSVVFGPGSIAQAHTKDEWIEIKQLEKAADVYYRFCASPPALSTT